MTKKVEPILFASDARGIYIPQHFAESIKREFVTGVSDEEFEILSYGPWPDNDRYWDTWEDVLRNAKITLDGEPYFLHQSGDLWVLPEGYEGPITEA